MCCINELLKLANGFSHLKPVRDTVCLAGCICLHCVHAFTLSHKCCLFCGIFRNCCKINISATFCLFSVLMRTGKAVQRRFWGKAQFKPVWWPEDIPFQSPNENRNGSKLTTFVWCKVTSEFCFLTYYGHQMLEHEHTLCCCVDKK